MFSTSEARGNPVSLEHYSIDMFYVSIMGSGLVIGKPTHNISERKIGLSPIKTQIPP